MNIPGQDQIGVGGNCVKMGSDNISVINPLEHTFSNAVLFLQDLEETLNDSLKFQLLLKISNLLHLEENRPIWRVLYPSSLLDNTIAKEVHSIQADLADCQRAIFTPSNFDF